MLVRPDDLYPPRAGAPARRVIDVRSPGEVARGAVPGAVELPILDDDERHAVGLRYAEEGQEAAIEEGRLRTEADMPRRTAAWRTAAAEMPSAFLCWRGGMRSELAQRFADHPGTPRVEGGYKALRAHLTASLEPSLARRRTWVLTGLTGSGKTELLTAAASLPALLALDLEGAAEHRGSAFGATGPQPAQATFEHRLLIPLLLGDEPTLLLENESSNVGRVHLPAPVHELVRSSPLLVLEEGLEARVRRIHREYALAPSRRHGEEATLAELVGAVRRLKRRLGAEPTERMAAALEDAHAQGAWHDPEAFRPVIEPLLRDYYDPLYRKATPTEGRTVAARGGREELLAWMRTNAAPSRA
jgi:tRNA 2-selenouridine synthase